MLKKCQCCASGMFCIYCLACAFQGEEYKKITGTGDFVKYRINETHRTDYQHKHS